MKVSVALGGGGAKGLAHIGVLKVLEREGVQIGAITGTSMGGIIASAYAVGHTAGELEHLAEGTPLGALLRLRPLGGGLFGLDRIAAFLRQVLGERSFSDLRIPLAVTAADIETGDSLTLSEGRVVDAVLATIALPGIFPPQIVGDHRVIDGGTLDPVPVAAARKLCDAPVVAVALAPPREEWAQVTPASPLQGLPILGTMARLRTGQAVQVFLRAMEICLRTYQELRLQVDRPEVIVRPRVFHIGLFDEPSVAMMVGLGAAAMESALPGLRAQFTAARRLQRWSRSIAKTWGT